MITVDGDSMEPLLPSDDRILIDTSQRVPVPPGTRPAHSIRNRRASDARVDYSSETTVKTHLQRVFEKTASRRQADLVKLVAGYSMLQTALSVAVGMGVSAHPPHRSVRAAFPHTALTLGD
jgi:hypothetical protein